MANEEVTFSDGKKSILYSTSSVRSDRMKGLQWDASNIKKINKNIEYAYVIVPDEGSFDQGTAVRDKIRNKSIVSAVDDIFTAEEFHERVAAVHGKTLNTGVKNDLEGRSLESIFAAVLKNEDNLKKFNGDENVIGYRYSLFEKVLKTLEVKQRDLTRIEATTNIPRLKTGGNAKTDVAASLFYSEGSECLVTFSLKSTSQGSVSVHEYTADTFADVLDKGNQKLRKLLNAFQEAGCIRDMSEEDKAGLASELEPYRSKLNRWVIGGGKAENISDIQVAQFLGIHEKGTGQFTICSVEDYCEKLKDREGFDRGFGTAYSWTYPSKKRGKSIQLKTKIT